MREIKFRIWNKIAKVFVEDCYRATTDMDESNGVMSNPINKIIAEIQEDDDVILLQYTGLKDKNGKEIYEGDIYKHGDYAIYNIEYKNPNKDYSNWNFSYDLDEFRQHPSEEWEVIGNIYENPDIKYEE